MKLQPIITSLLDTDLYKFNMNQVIFHKHTDLTGKYYFKCRSKNIIFTKEIFDEINEQINHLCTLTFKADELAYLHTIRFLKSDYIEFLRLWRPLRDYVHTSLDSNGELHIVVEGPCFSAMQFEIYLLEIVSEVYFRMTYNYDKLLEAARKKLYDKIAARKAGKYNFRFAEFGCRRRLSKEWEDEMLHTLLKETPGWCVGTSNVYLAKKYNILPIGTSAHEMTQMYQGILKLPLAYGNYYMLKDWYDEYQGDNGIALTDTLTTDLFLLDFDLANSNNYKGVRHDSGDPDEWAHKIINHYKSLAIDPKTKTLLFSDSLNCDKAERLYQEYHNITNVQFGIGTHFSNDTDIPALNIVLKLQYINGNPVAKISDTPGKTMCQDQSYVTYLENAIKFRLQREGTKNE